MKILVVDDDPAILRLCSVTLRSVGHVVIACDAGGPALQAALTETLDLALCDLGLPDIHGLDVVRAIKMQNPGLPVIVMSAMDPREWAQRATEAGASHYLSKPLRLEALRHEVELVQSGLADLDVVVADSDPLHGRRLALALQQAGCRVQEVRDAPSVRGIPGHIDLVVVDGAIADVGSVIEHCADRGITCFVSVGAGANDDPLLRAGAAMIVQRPVDPDALLAQARFLR
ncbi:MAG: response regulator [Deltaproteobacteria bacterium]|nr:response regulator [Deltaproteobacteria bacterium]